MECFYCKIHKDVETDFRRTSGNKPQCKACYSKYISDYLKSRPEKTAKNREYAKKSKPARRRARKNLVQILKSAPCSDCGQRFHPEVMDFDHIQDGTKGGKHMSISNLTSRALSEQDLLAHIRQCELVCSNCHRIRTVKRRIGVDAYYAQIPFQ